MVNPTPPSPGAPAQADDGHANPSGISGWWTRWLRLWRHRWHEPQARRLMTPALQRALCERIAASEQRHTGQIAVFVEGGLPDHYIRHAKTARERAWALFGKLGIWDTEYNNGVLIYLLMAEHAIEIVADRGLRARLDDAAWSQVVADLGQALQKGAHARGLETAIDAVGALLEAHFPRGPQHAKSGEDPPDEVPNLPRLRGQ